MRPEFSIIIPTHFRHAGLDALLRSILEQRNAPNFEVLIVSNLQDEEARQLVSRYDERFRYFEVGVLGVNRARNLGIENADGEYLFFLDDDCVLDDVSILEKHLYYHRLYPHACGIGGKYRLPAYSNPFELTYHFIAEHWLMRSKITDVQTTNLIGGHCSFKRELAREVLKFDDSIEFGGAETELMARMVAQGRELLLFEELKVEHQMKLNLQDFLRKAFLQGYSAMVRRNQNLSLPKIKGKKPKSLMQLIAANGVYLDWKIRFLIWLFDLSFEAGQKAATKGLPRRFRFSTLLDPLYYRSVNHWYRSSVSLFVSDLYFGLKLSAWERHARSKKLFELR